MKTNYTILVEKFSKYFGETNEHHQKNKIHSEEYRYNIDDYQKAIELYEEQISSCAHFSSLPLNFWTHRYTIQLISNNETNPINNHDHIGLVYREVTISSL